VRIAVNLPAHIDWASRRRVGEGTLSRVITYGLVVAFLGGMALAGQLLASAAEAFEAAQAPEPTVMAAIVSATPRSTSGLATPVPTPSATATPPPLPPDFVARLRAPRLGIDHYVVKLGVINNQMQSPDADGVRAVGWYPEYGTPGRAVNAVFSAHESWELQHGPFYSMAKAKVGDEFSVEMTSGARFRYEVISNRRYPEHAIPMGEIIWPSNQARGEEWVTFITCGGRFVQTQANGLGEYLDRDVVVARRVP